MPEEAERTPPPTPDGDAEQQQPQQQQQQTQGGPSFSTASDVVEHIRELIDTQLERRVGMALAPNASIPGDAKVRSAFFTLLPKLAQRQLFLSTANKSANWPALRGLFGAPPYSFLFPQDASVLRAAGIAHRRVEMAYQEASVENYAQFGNGHLEDAFEREYKLISNAESRDDAPPVWAIGNQHGHSSSNNLLQLVVRVRKRTREERMRRLRDTNLKASMTFPAPGERLLLKHTKRMLKLTGTTAGGAESLTLKVHRVVPRGVNAATAAVLASIAV